MRTPTLADRLKGLLILLSMVLCLPSVARTVDKDFIYILGANIDGYGAWQFEPDVKNQEYFAHAKLYKTESGVFEGIFDMNSQCYFRFVSDLADSEATRVSPWNQNVIQPDEDRSAMAEIGKSGVYYSNSMVTERVIGSLVTTTWAVPQTGTYLFHVDTNKGEVYAVAADDPLVLINDDSTPTLMSVARYCSANKSAQYVPDGNVSIRLFNLAENKWLNPATPVAADITGNMQSGYGFMNLAPASAKGEPFAINGWKGGVLSCSYESASYAILYVTPDAVFTPISPSSIYAIGGFCDWSWPNALKADRETVGGDDIYRFTIPAGTENEFKLTVDADWLAGQIIVTRLLETNTVGKAIYGIYVDSSASSANHVTHTLPLDIEINLTKGTLAVDASANVRFSTGVNGSVDRNSVFLQTPGDAIVPSASSHDTEITHCNALTQNADGTWSGSVYSTGTTKVRFITALGKDAESNTVVGPATDGNQSISLVNGELLVSGKTALASESGYWEIPCNGHSYYISFTPGDKPKVVFNDPAAVPSHCIYLVGAPSGWITPSIDNSEHYADWELLLTDKGGYYGEFEIGVGDAMFRFYSALSGWEESSLGYQYNDFAEPVDFTPGEVNSYPCVTGKGAYDVNNSWTGGTMYMYVDPSNRRTYLSDVPLLASLTGTVVDNSVRPDERESVYCYYNGKMTEFKKVSDGLYAGEVGSGEFRLFTRQLSIATSEPEWSGSYALSAPAPAYGPEFDEYQVAESTFVHQNELTDKGGNSFFARGYITYVTVDLNAGKVYMEDGDFRVPYLTGAIAGDKPLTYANRKEFAGLRLGYGYGAVIDIPAGKFDFTVQSSIYSAMTGISFVEPSEQEIVFNDGVAVASNRNFGWDNCNVKCPDWKGGKIALTFTEMVDMSTVDEIFCFDYANYTKTDILKRVSKDGLVFKGNISLVDGSRTTSLVLVQYRAPDSGLLNLSIGSTFRSLYYSGSEYSIGNNILDEPVDGKTSAICGFNTSGFTLPWLASDTEISATIDLDNMQATFEIPESAVGTTYETVTGSKETLLYPSTRTENAAKGTYSASSSAFDLNFICSDGSVIVPASGAPESVKFDENGVYTGKFVRKAVATTSRARLRDRAAQSPAWHVALPSLSESGKDLAILIDEKSSTLTVYAPAAQKTFFIEVQTLTNYEYNRDHSVVMENLDVAAKTVLRSIADGIYEGEAAIPDDSSFIVLLHGLSEGNMGAPVTNLGGRIIVLDENQPVVTALGMEGSYGSIYWHVNTSAEKVKIRYNVPESTVTFTADIAGVDNVAVDRDDLTVEAGQGRIIVTCNADTDLAVYNLSGMLVKRVSLTAGTTVIDMAPGLYIAAGHKLLVK